VFAKNAFPRIVVYFKKKGLTATIYRLIVYTKQLFTAKRDVIFIYNINNFSNNILPPNNYKIEAKSNESEISEIDMDLLAQNNINMKIMQTYMRERFAQKGSLWLFKIDNVLVGYFWTVIGISYDHFFPIASNDVYFVDIKIFEQFRGKNMFNYMMKMILSKLKEQGVIRGYYTVHEWNEPMLRATNKMGAEMLGYIRKYRILGKEIISWNQVNSLK